MEGNTAASSSQRSCVYRTQIQATRTELAAAVSLLSPPFSSLPAQTPRSVIKSSTGVQKEADTTLVPLCHQKFREYQAAGAQELVRGNHPAQRLPRDCHLANDQSISGNGSQFLTASLTSQPDVHKLRCYLC